MNDVAILYAEGPILRRTDGHLKYVALAQVLVESGVQFDVVYAGDGRFNPEELDRAALERYRTTWCRRHWTWVRPPPMR